MISKPITREEFEIEVSEERKREQSLEIAEHVKEYLATGGEISVLPPRGLDDNEVLQRVNEQLNKQQAQKRTRDRIRAAKKEKRQHRMMMKKNKKIVRDNRKLRA